MPAELIVLILIIFIIIGLMGFSVFFGAPYVPTRKKWAKNALDLVSLNKKDLVVDLGSGDGVILKLISERGARCVGYEINPILFLLSKIRTMKCVPKPKIYLQNYWLENLPPETTIVYIFGAERDANKFEKYLYRQGIKNLKVITFGFKLPNKKPKKSNKFASLYILPICHPRTDLVVSSEVERS